MAVDLFLVDNPMSQYPQGPYFGSPSAYPTKYILFIFNLSIFFFVPGFDFLFLF